MVMPVSSVKIMDLAQTKPSTEWYQTLSHKLLIVQRVKGLTSKTTSHLLKYLLFSEGTFYTWYSIIITNMLTIGFQTEPGYIQSIKCHIVALALKNSWFSLTWLMGEKGAPRSIL